MADKTYTLSYSKTLTRSCDLGCLFWIKTKAEFNMLHMKTLCILIMHALVNSCWLFMHENRSNDALLHSFSVIKL